MEDEMISVAIGLDFMKERGVTHLAMFFYGGGDSGHIESKYAISSELVNEDGSLAVDQHSSEFSENILDVDLPQVVWDHLENKVSFQDHDWWNNEGGSGYIVIDIEGLSYYVHYNLNGEDEGDGDWDDPDYEPQYATWIETGGGKLEL